MKIIWKGSIAFGLVSIPIRLYSAVESHALGFTLLHETCKTPLEYRRWCPHCKKEVKWDQTVKGMKKPDGKYLVLSQETIKKLRPEKTEAIQIVEFVDADQVDVIYLDNHYYLSPGADADTPFALFMTALEKLSKVAIGRFVMRDKEYTCMIQPYKEYLLLTTLHYAYEIRGVEDLAFTKKVKLQPTELKLAKEFIKKLSVKKFDMSQFKDTFAQEIKALLKKKGKAGVVKPKTVKPKRTKKPSLTSSLEESIKSIHHVRRKPTTRRPVARAKKKR